MRYGLFDSNGNYCGYDSDKYGDVYERAKALNMHYQQGLEDSYYHVEDIDEDELDNIRDIDGDADIPF